MELLSWVPTSNPQEVLGVLCAPMVDSASSLRFAGGGVGHLLDCATHRQRPLLEHFLRLHLLEHSLRIARKQRIRIRLRRTLALLEQRLDLPAPFAAPSALGLVHARHGESPITGRDDLLFHKAGGFVCTALHGEPIGPPQQLRCLLIWLQQAIERAAVRGATPRRGIVAAPQKAQRRKGRGQDRYQPALKRHA